MQEPSKCQCGKTPTIDIRHVPHGHIIQVKCPCGNKGIEALYKLESDLQRTIKSAIDAWDIMNIPL
jgi:hypothetical protein